VVPLGTVGNLTALQTLSLRLNALSGGKLAPLPILTVGSESNPSEKGEVTCDFF
jgi:hypothetical protein